MDTTIDLSGICLAILEQGEKKGQRCWRHIAKDGFCGKHQTQAILTKGKEGGKVKCKKFRCNTLIEQSNTNSYCNECQEKKKKERETVKLCIAIVQQYTNKGKQCDKAASHGDYCGKHYEYNIRLQEASAKNIRICDDGKRACKKSTTDGKLKCDECLAKARDSDNSTYAIRQIDTSLCLGCGKTIDTFIKGKWEKNIQQCEKCYILQRRIEESRERIERDYNKERKANIDRHMNEYISSSYKRGKPFELTEKQFEELVSGICVYCGFQSDTVIGIDRIDSEKGYTLENTVPCCATCNMIKGTLTQQQLKEHITKMYFHLSKEIPQVELTKHCIGKSWLRPSEILSIINKKNLDEYIQWCKDDTRSPTFIIKLEEIKSLTMNYSETLAYIKNALRTESNKQKRTTTNTRQRIIKEELYGYLEMGASTKFIEHYESVHGKCEEVLQEVASLLSVWKDLSKEDKQTQLTKSLVRLQNKRNRATTKDTICH